MCENVLHDYTIKEVIKNNRLFDKHNFNKIKNNPEYRICPYCGDSYCKYDYLKKWNKKCPNCKKECCFNCGMKHSKDSKCYDIGRETTVEMAKYYRNNNIVVKRCPHCNLLQERFDGCNHVVCGNNYYFHKKIKQNGCGRSFSWKEAKKENFDNVELGTKRQKNFETKRQRNFNENKICFDSVFFACICPCVYCFLNLIDDD
jgi:hypothetical protein